jgi:CRISPR-associated protein Cst2
MGMYANHDMVRRAKEQGNLAKDANPNPFNKEEHTSFYKITFTIDSEKLGADKWIVPEYSYNEEDKVLKLGDYREISQVERPNDDANSFKTDNGYIRIKSLSNSSYLVFFESNKKAERINHILNTLKNGIMSHTSGESNTITPLFMIASDVKIPSPVFHSYIDVIRNNNGEYEIIGLKDGLNNGWLGDNKYLFESERLKAQDKKLNTDWNAFISELKLQNENE